jgi:elongator complex protein 3
LYFSVFDYEKVVFILKEILFPPMQRFIPLVYQLLSEVSTLTPDRIKDLQRAFAKEQKMQTLPSKSQILQTYFQLVATGAIAKNADFETLLRKRAIRSLSGIVSVQVLTKPRPCPGKCIFCPNDPTMPKSYIKSEPGAMRAFLNQFDPMKQVYNRLQSLTLTGHQPDKIELIVLGGSRDAYPLDYQEEFLKGLYDACTTFASLDIRMHNEKGDAKYGFDILNLDTLQLSSSLEEAIEKNQTAKHRVIGLTIETRPDLVHHSNCQRWREF